MKNLAENPEADKYTKLELTAAGIPIVRSKQPQRGEVPTCLSGILTKDGQQVFTFYRAWYYWTIRGDVPLAVAQEIYSNPIGLQDVRADGDCACRPPETWATKNGVGELIVDLYHIDSVEGLKLFVDVIRNYKLAD